MPGKPTTQEAAQAEKPLAPDPPRYRPLSGVERFFSAAAGLTLATVAVVVMFYGKNDVADSVAILVGGVLVLMAIQGTPLIKLGVKDANVELGGRREAVVEIAKARAVEDPGEAKALIQGYQLADPQARQDPAFLQIAREMDEGHRFIDVISEDLTAAADELFGDDYDLTFTGTYGEYMLRLPDDIRVAVYARPGALVDYRFVADLVYLIARVRADVALVITPFTVSFESAETRASIQVPIKLYDSRSGRPNLVPILQVVSEAGRNHRDRRVQ